MNGCIKKSRILQVVTFVVCFLFLTPGLLFADEEDPATVAKRKAALAAAFSNNFCLDCHGATPKHNLRSARAGYEHSVHKNGGNSFYANGTECVRCHTTEGFINYVTTGKFDPKGYVPAPSQPGCFACHDPHITGDMSLRTKKPVTMSNGAVFDMGEGNLCANCHQTRGKAKELIKEYPAKKLAGYWGAHHGGQSDMVLGNNAYEYAGKNYYSSVHGKLVKNSCVDCHMATPKGRFSYSPGMAGHSFEIVGEVHHAPKLNAAGCLGNCHAKVKQVIAKNEDTPLKGFWWHQTDAVFDIQAKADFDNDGKSEPLQSEVEGLMNLLVNNKGTGYLQKGDLPLYKKDGTWNWNRSDKIRTVKEVAAVYNYKYVAEDRSRGVHNAPYTIQILYDTIQSLDPGFDASKRNVYRPPEEYKAQ